MLPCRLITLICMVNTARVCMLLILLSEEVEINRTLEKSICLFLPGSFWKLDHWHFKSIQMHALSICACNINKRWIKDLRRYELKDQKIILRKNERFITRHFGVLMTPLSSEMWIILQSSKIQEMIMESHLVSLDNGVMRTPKRRVINLSFSFLVACNVLTKLYLKRKKKDNVRGGNDPWLALILNLRALKTSKWPILILRLLNFPHHAFSLMWRQCPGGPQYSYT